MNKQNSKLKNMLPYIILVIVIGIILIVIATFDNPYKNANINPTSNIVKFNLLGIICSL